MGHSLLIEHHQVHLLAQGGSARTPLMLDSLSVHANLNAPSKAAATALVPACLVHLTSLALSGLAEILPPSPNGSFEEASTSVAGKDPVVLARREVSAHLAGSVIQDPAGRTAGSSSSSLGTPWTAILIILGTLIWIV